MSDLSTRIGAHLVHLAPATDWAMWRSSCLRSTGFAVERLNLLSDAEATAAANDLNALRARLDQHRLDTVAVLQECLDTLSRSGQWDTPDRKLLLGAITKVNKNRAVSAELPPPATKAITELQQLRQSVHTAEAHYNAVWEAAGWRTSAAVDEIVSDDRFAEAIIWQNRAAYRSVIQDLRGDAVTGHTRNQSRRRREELVARYAQRYFAKNDSIGFFGPISWASFTDDGPEFDVRCGPNLIGERRFYYEQWGVDAVAEVIGGLPGARSWARPRRLPFTHLTEDAVYSPALGTLPLSPGQSALLAACCARRSAAELAAEAIAWGDPELQDEADVFAFLADMSNRGVIEWRLEIPFRSHPHHTLEALFDQIGDDKLRATAQRILQVYRKAIDRVAASVGTVTELDRSMERAETMFTKLTSTAAVRRTGQMYAARTLYYEDCLRDVDVNLGPALRDAISQPLTLVLQSLRWHTATVATHATEHLHVLFEDLCQEQGLTVVPAATLWQAMPRLMPAIGTDMDTPTPFIAELCDEYRRRWRDLLAVDPDARVARRDSAQLRDRVAEAFPATRPGWQQARYHSPDILLDAADVAAVARGDYQLVLGEMHAANNTLVIARFADNHPTPEALPEFISADLPGRLTLPMAPRHWRGITSSTRYAVAAEDDLHLQMTHEFVDPDVADSHRINIAELVIVNENGELRARTYDRRVDISLLDLLGDLLSSSVVGAFSLLEPGPHTPRICVDRLVLQREAWRVPVAEIADLIDNDEAARFAAFRRFATDRMMPERVFVKVSTEDKPVLLDFSSPILVAVVTKVLRRAVEAAAEGDTIILSEMLPEQAGSWLTDSQGNHYTSEFRTVIVDLSDPHPTSNAH